MTLYSCPSVRKSDSLASSWAAMASTSRPLTRYASAPAAASGREQTQHQKHTGERSGRRWRCRSACRRAGSPSSVSDFSKPSSPGRPTSRRPSAGHARSATRRPRAQQHQTEILGAAPVRRAAVVGLTRRRSRRAPRHKVRRECLPPGCDVRQRLGVADQAEPVAGRRLVRVVARDRGGFEITRVVRGRQDRPRGRPGLPTRGAPRSSGRCHGIDWSRLPG